MHSSQRGYDHSLIYSKMSSSLGIVWAVSNVKQTNYIQMVIYYYKYLPF